MGKLVLYPLLEVGLDLKYNLILFLGSLVWVWICHRIIKLAMQSKT